MKQTINETDFIDAFNRIRPENFSYEGLQKLFEYLEQLEQDTGEELELDVIAICCDYTESTIEDALKDNNCESIEELESDTQVIRVDDETVIYQNY